MSMTVTQTVEMPKTLILSLIPIKSAELLDQLAIILEKFASWEDDLSKEIFKWGANAVLLTAECEGMDINEFRERVRKQLDNLEYEILVNPLTKQPLQSPYLDRKWVWEQSALEDYQQLSQHSPFDGKAIDARAHDFAMAAIEWLRTVRQTNNIVHEGQREELAIGNLISADVPVEQRMYNYKFLASWAHAMKRQKIFQNTCKDVERMYEQNAKQMRAMFRQKEEALQQRIQESEQLQRDRLDMLRNENQVKIDLGKLQMDDLERKKGVANEQLANANQSIQALTTRINSLLQEQTKDKQEIRRLRDEVDDMCVIL